MYRRATALAVLALAGSPGVAAASTELNVIPHGQTQPGVSWATQPGMLPADAQARMYDRLTPFGADITDAMLAPSADGSGFFKSAAAQAGRRPVVPHRRDDHGHRRRHHADRAHPARRATACRTSTRPPTPA